MDKESVVKYAPLILVVCAILFQYNLFVTPEKLEQKHREILQEVSTIYATKEQSNDIKTELSDMRKLLNEIYKVIMERGK